MKILLINYDNGSRWPVTPQNLYVLGEALHRHHDVSMIDFNATKTPYTDIYDLEFDIIGLGFIAGYWQHMQAQIIADVINKASNRSDFKFIIGGHGPSAAPDYYLKLLGADAVFIGAAEKSLADWIDSGRPSGVIPSAGFSKKIAVPGNLPWDIYKRVRFPKTKENEFTMQILSGRGCPYSCAFCYRADKTFYQYKIEQVICLIQWYVIKHGIRHFQFSDELFMSNSRYIHNMCSALINLQERSTMPSLAFDCNGRLNKAIPENLKIMKQAGFRYINYGCEALDDDVLEQMNKHQSVMDIYNGVEATVAAGISPGLNFMWGNPGDDLRTLRQAREFIMEHSDGCELRTIRPVTPYPGTPLFKRLIKEGRLPDAYFDDPVDAFYKQHVNSDLFSYHWMDLSNAEADRELGQANEMIAEDYYQTKMSAMFVEARDFYSHKTDPLKFRGWREV